MLVVVWERLTEQLGKVEKAFAAGRIQRRAGEEMRGPTAQGIAKFGTYQISFTVHICGAHLRGSWGILSREFR